VLINLLKNALKFTRQGKITIEACYILSQHQLQVKIIDTGVGIESSEAEKLFKPYGKLKNSVTQSHNPEGIGLGLQICKNLVHHNGGKICVKSAGKGEGSTF